MMKMKNMTWQIEQRPTITIKKYDNNYVSFDSFGIHRHLKIHLESRFKFIFSFIINQI